MSDMCPCGSKLTYVDCCQPLHLNQIIAQTPEQLMRSRYCAFVKQQFEYLIATHHAEFLNGLTIEHLKQDLPHWLALEVEDASQQDHCGSVTFKAWYKTINGVDAIYERSAFIKQNGQWFYTQGEQFEVNRPKRNDACVCNSGKKYKQCCLK